MKEPIIVDSEKRTLAIPHWGVTLRSLFGAALRTWPHARPGQSRQFDVLHKGAVIGSITVRQHNDLKEIPHAPSDE